MMFALYFISRHKLLSPGKIIGVVKLELYFLLLFVKTVSRFF